MTARAEKIAEECRDLSVVDRIMLAERLMRSVHPYSVEVEQAWDAEVAHRVAEIDAGADVLVDGAAVLRELRSRYGR